jgi:hypothetical protein
LIFRSFFKLKNIRIYLFACFIIFLCFSACNKGTLNPNTGPPSGTDTSIETSKSLYLFGMNGEENYTNTTIFTYDSTNKRLTKILNRLNDQEFYVYYQKDLMNYIRYAFDNANGLYSKTALIFLYNHDRKCNRVIYKDAYETYDQNSSKLDDIDPYYSNSTDGKYVYYDSIIYSSTNQFKEIWTYTRGELVSQFKFIYPDEQNQTPSAIQYYSQQYNNGNLEILLDTEIKLSTNEMDNPSYNFFWFSRFVSALSSNADDYGGFRVPTVPHEPFFPHCILTMVPKCITHYEINQPSGYNYNSLQFAYSYNSDSTQFKGYIVNGEVGSDAVSYSMVRF